MPTSSMRPHLRSALAVVAVLAGVAACDTDDGRTLRDPVAPPPTTTVATTLEPLPGLDDLSTAPPTTAASLGEEFRLLATWADGAPIDARHTCDGDDVSPALSWTGVPDGTAELAITVTDDDAAGFVHWAVVGIDPSFFSLSEGTIPDGAVELGNSFGSAGWAGPCPPPGSPHHYRFTLHALNQPLGSTDGVAVDELSTLIDEFELASATVIGTYGR